MSRPILVVAALIVFPLAALSQESEETRDFTWYTNCNIVGLSVAVADLADSGLTQEIVESVIESKMWQERVPYDPTGAPHLRALILVHQDSSYRVSLWMEKEMTDLATGITDYAKTWDVHYTGVSEHRAQYGAILDKLIYGLELFAGLYKRENLEACDQ
ncbi:MAG: hypothetical protein F4008_11105 [Gammaproteobacteria bacterium]|nr:hypothetical protein [Gammaproteobacteria bacterium]MYL14290.1 hypothetical protein [Gammaproteobacteria bacterium]